MKRLAPLLVALLVGALAAQPALGAIGTPAELGTATQATAVATTMPLTTTQDCPSGSLIVVFALSHGSVAVSGVADTINTYTALNSLLTGSNTDTMRAFYSANVTDLPNASTITITFSSSTGVKAASAVCVSGVATSSANDINGAGAGGTSTTPSFTSGVLAQSTEIAFGLLGISNVSTVTEASGYTALTEATTGVDKIHWAYKKNAGTTAETYNPTMGTSRSWGANIITFVAPGAATGAPRLLLLGVGQ